MQITPKSELVITMNNIEENPEYTWNYKCISHNPTLIEDFISKYFNKNWNWNFISDNPNITSNPTVTFDIVKRHFNCSKNPNISPGYYVSD